VKKEPTQKKCEWCNKWFPTKRDGRFCKPAHRTAWHRQKELDENLRVFKTLRKALDFCCSENPRLIPGVNQILSNAALRLEKPTSHPSDPQP
jgi:hypothetical protein